MIPAYLPSDLRGMSQPGGRGRIVQFLDQNIRGPAEVQSTGGPARKTSGHDMAEIPNNLCTPEISHQSPAGLPKLHPCTTAVSGRLSTGATQ